MTDQSDTTKAHIITLTQILDLTAANPLKEELLAVREQEICINAENVERLGAQCLQVLLSASRTWAADKKSFSISNPSEAFEGTLNTFGFDTKTLAPHIQQESA